MGFNGDDFEVERDVGGGEGDLVGEEGVVPLGDGDEGVQDFRVDLVEVFDDEEECCRQECKAETKAESYRRR